MTFPGARTCQSQELCIEGLEPHPQSTARFFRGLLQRRRGKQCQRALRRRTNPFIRILVTQAEEADQRSPPRPLNSA